MEMDDLHSSPVMPDNAEESIKCPQCGNFIGIGGLSDAGSIVCPVCGASTDIVSIEDAFRMGTSNEGY